MRLVDLGQARETLDEAARIMTICNSCRYCESLCAVFPAMEIRRQFTDVDLDYLANLCHGCGACYFDCQFAPPHEFAVNVPQTFARLRRWSYRAHAWPGAFSGFFDRNGMIMALVAAFSVAAFIAGFVARNDTFALFHADAGHFYALMPHAAMAWIFSLAFLYALVAMTFSAWDFRKAIHGSGRADLAAWGQALGDGARLRYLDGGGGGCMRESEKPDDRRRFFHHLVFYGFLLCFAATGIATLYHYIWHWEAPYRWYDLPVILGTAGGIGLVAGTLGLAYEKGRADPMLKDNDDGGMGAAFLATLGLVGASGLILLVLRDSSVMGILLALHLGLVFALFITMPYGKFIHGIFRGIALLHYARERPRH